MARPIVPQPTTENIPSNNGRAAPSITTGLSPNSLSRVTRSSARLAAGSAATNPPPPPTPAAPPSRKRRAPAASNPGPPAPEHPTQSPPEQPRNKRIKVTHVDLPPSPRRRATRPATTMSTPGSSSHPTEEPKPTATASNPSKRSSRSKKSAPGQDTSPPSQTPSARRQKKRTSKRDDDDTIMKEADGNPGGSAKDGRGESPHGDPSDSNDGGASPRGIDDDEGDDPFSRGYLGGSRFGMSNTLRALNSMMSGVSSRLRDILTNLRQKDDPSIQLIALQELSDLLLVSNEDNLSGQFSPDPYVKELVTLMQPSETGEENQEMMLLACRCIANLMEALQGSVANVVYGGAVPVLCQKLLEIQFIDLAEQALSTLAKISVDFPGSIVREGGLTACLTYLDFFPTSTQRTAVTTAANCCRNIPEDSFPVIRDVMPILLNVLQTHDQKVVEQGCLCVSRIVESFKFKRDMLEELVSPDLLRAILRLLLPGTTNLIGPNIHTQFLRVLSITSLTSPRLSVELLKMNVVDTLYQILTGVSPPSNTEDVASKIDSVVIMQALIHRPREQVFETLNVICELLPDVPSRHGVMFDSDLDVGYPEDSLSSLHSSSKSTNQKRIELLNDCKQETKRFAMILLPTLTDAYSSTVNLQVRQKVISAQLKMLSNLDTQIIEDALRDVPYASFLASILSQQDHPTLVHFALQAAELLLERLEHIYQYQFYREGVIAEIKKLSEEPLEGDEPQLKHEKSRASIDSGEPGTGTESHTDPENDENMDDASSEDDGDDDDGHDDEDGADDDHDDDHDNISASESSSSSDEDSIMMAASSVKDLMTLRAKKLLETHQSALGQEKCDQAAQILLDLQTLAKDIEDHYVHGGASDGPELFSRLATYFDGDAIQSITSSELLNSGIVRVLLEVFDPANGYSSSDAKTEFLSSFMRHTKYGLSKVTGTETPSTPFGVLVHKLQDLLSRSEHFEVITVHNSSDSGRSSAASMLAKQLRLKLVADDDSDIPRPYRNIMVSIHAIANFKALDDYLRPRISLSERPRGSRHRDAMSSTLAAYASAARARDAHDRGSDRPSDGGLFGPGGELGWLPPPPAASAPSGRKKIASKTKTGTSNPPQEPRPSSARDKASSSRRSSRRNPKPAEAPPEPEPSSQPLECADERQLSDDDEGDDDGPLDAIVDDLDDDLSDDDVIDPTAVNMEIASTGKVTARTEDGTRVATPQASTPVSRPSSAAHPAMSQPPAPSLALAGRPFSSYAAAMAAIPQDWHIEFSMDEKNIPNETTIYRAVYHNKLQPDDAAARNIWSAIHSIKFKRVRGPPPPEPSSISSVLETSPEPTASGMPVSLDKHATTSSILKLLSLLHELNSTMDDIFAERKGIVAIKPEPLAQFINTKLTAKMNRQLEEPLIVASSCLPTWSEDLARFFPFLFPFETRHLFLQSTSYGYSRSMQRWQNSQSNDDDRRDRRRDDRPFLGRLQRQKVRISRTRILESAVKVMELYGASPSVLEVEFFDEVGTGLGPTLEFYSTVSKEFSKKKLKLWRENDSNDRDEFAFGKLGLFPAPMSEEQANHENGKKVLHLFKMLGKFVARAMFDSRIVDVSFNPTFFRIGEVRSAFKLSLGTVKSVDSDLARSLMLVKEFSNMKKKIEENGQLNAAEKVHSMYAIEIYGTQIEDLGLDFTLPGYPAIDLVPGGSNIALTIDNVDLYLEKVIDFTMGSGVKRQVDAFRAGFSQVFPYTALRAFTPAELVMLLGRSDEDWSIETLMDSIKADHGFNMDSKSVRNLLQTMSELEPPQRRDFLQFVTGSPKLPIGGFKSLTPMFTVVCKPSEPPYSSDDYLPSVMTCVNYLKLPDYTNLEVLRERLNMAIREGQGAFHLS